jgi:biopolymer transport protein ExbD
MRLIKEIEPPNINVTPLIDVLLVLLIIFMVATPLKPTRFKTQVPHEPDKRDLPPNPNTLVVSINKDLSLDLNGIKNLGSVNDTSLLSSKLTSLFQQRETSLTYEPKAGDALARYSPDSSYKTVFIKAPRSIGYGEVAKVIDSLKGAGAAPIGLQLDNLD